MARYRLPEALGGGEHEEFHGADGKSPAPYGTQAFLIAVDGSSINPSTDGGYVVYVAKDLLTEVKPPLPPEPRNTGAVVEVEGMGLWVRSITSSTATPWLGVHSRQTLSWAELCDSGTPIRYVPDPFAGIVVYEGRNGPVRLDPARVHILRDEPLADWERDLLERGATP